MVWRSWGGALRALPQAILFPAFSVMNLAGVQDLNSDYLVLVIQFNGDVGAEFDAFALGSSVMTRCSTSSSSKYLRRTLFMLAILNDVVVHCQG